MLRLVHPAPEGQPTRPPKPRKRVLAASLLPTHEERRHIAQALKNARRAYGSWSCLAEVMGMTAKSLESVPGSLRTRGSYGLAVAIARALHTTVEAVLTGRLTDTSRCASCGSTLRERAALAACGGAR